MKFSVLSWNVRHFNGNEDRLTEVDRVISSVNPDVFALLEFRAKDYMRKLMFDFFEEYDFAVTDSKNNLEITVGFRRGKFRQTIWTQRREFLNQNLNLRPGGLLSVNFEGNYYNLLFLHTDSGTSERDFNNRAAMFDKMFHLNTRLKEINDDGQSRLIALGDYNTMGLGTSITGEDEIEELSIKCTQNHMSILPKDESKTWHQWGKGPRNDRRPLRVDELQGAKKSDLDHVIASNDLSFADIDSNNNKVKVIGWSQLHGEERIKHLWDISDHTGIYCEIE